MTESEAKTKPISEVWAHFQIATLPTMLTPDGYIPMLRAVLLERCKTVFASDGDSMQLIPSENAPYIIIAKNRHETLAHTPENLLDFSSAYAFWAWELKQRNYESNEPN